MADDKTSRSRRAFNAQALALGAAMLGGGAGLVRAADDSDARRAKSWQSRLAANPRLFCIAYITPDLPAQAGQEAAVARYPLTIVPQERRVPSLRWREKIRELNPDIVMLGYQMVIEDTTVPGPGHDVMRQLQGCWANSADGSALSVAVGSPDKKRRIYDPRKPEWRNKFVEACIATLHSEPYDGLFLDQCTIYNVASADSGAREEMRAGIQEALKELRRREPDALIIANSSLTFDSVNGELNESRPRDYAAELAPRAGHSEPVVEMAHMVVQSPADRAALRSQYVAARQMGAWFGASRDYQHVEWYEEFDIPQPVPNPPSKPTLRSN